MPKRMPVFGWTVNLAYPLGAPLLMALGVVVGVVMTAALLR